MLSFPVVSATVSYIGGGGAWMGEVFIGSFVFTLFFITKQMAIVMSAVTTDDRAPLTHIDNKTARGHDKPNKSFKKVPKFNIVQVESLQRSLKHSIPHITKTLSYTCKGISPTPVQL